MTVLIGSIIGSIIGLLLSAIACIMLLILGWRVHLDMYKMYSKGDQELSNSGDLSGGKLSLKEIKELVISTNWDEMRDDCNFSGKAYSMFLDIDERIKEPLSNKLHASLIIFNKKYYKLGLISFYRFRSWLVKYQQEIDY